MRMRTFWALLHRDLLVAIRDFYSFLIRTLIQPLLLVFIFGNVLPRLSLVSSSMTTVLFPGILGMSMMFAGMQSVMFPLIFDFGWTKEIEDRLLAPIGVKAVAMEKIVMGTIQAITTGIAIFPLAIWAMHGKIGFSVQHPLLLAVIVLLVGTVSAALGLFLGTAVAGERIGLVMSAIIAPLIMFGCIYYPWAFLDRIPWFQKVVLFNPLVYMNEGLRASLTPAIPHMPIALIIFALAAFSVLFIYFGLQKFDRKAID